MAGLPSQSGARFLGLGSLSTLVPGSQAGFSSCSRVVAAGEAMARAGECAGTAAAPASAAREQLR